MGSLDLRDTADGVIVSVIVKTKGKENAVIGTHDNALRVSVTAAPQKGKANASVVEVLAEFFGVPKLNVILRLGETSKRKSFLIKGRTRIEVSEVLTRKGLI